MRMLLLLILLTSCTVQKKARKPVYTKEQKRTYIMAVIYAGGLITFGEIMSRRN
jgi:hypothetical protein